MPSSRGFSPPRDQTRVSCVSCNGRWILYYWATWEALRYGKKKKIAYKENTYCFKRTKGCPFPTWAETEAELSEGGVGGGATLPLSNPTKEGDWPLTWSSVGHPDQSNANQRLVKRYPIRMFCAQRGKVNTPLSGENSSLEAQGVFLRNLPFGYAGM